MFSRGLERGFGLQSLGGVRGRGRRGPWEEGVLALGGLEGGKGALLAGDTSSDLRMKNRG